MRRRRFIGIAVGTIVLPAVAWAQGKTARIGFLATTNPEGTPHFKAFRERLRHFGWVEGKNLVLDVRWTEGSFENHADLVTELVRLKVDVLLVFGSAALTAARRATSTVPIVFGAVGDPVGAGFVASLTRPGGNVTGVSNMARDVTAKQLQLLMQVAPGIRRVAVVRNPDNPITALLQKEIEAAARALGVQLDALEARTPAEIERGLEGLKNLRSGGIVLLADPMITGQLKKIAAAAIKSRTPSIYLGEIYPEAGGLMSYGPNPVGQFARCADYVDRILRGAKPADLPVEQPTVLDLVINLKTAKALDLAIPQSLLLRADRVIE